MNLGQMTYLTEFAGSVSSRMLVMKFLFCLFFLLIVARLYDIQILQAGRFRAIAIQQHYAKWTIESRRGKLPRSVR